MIRILRTYIPELLAVTLYAAIFALILRQTMALTGGHLGYALDDAYIHLSMVKNLTQHGVWGVTPYEFAGASSSPLWVLLLSALSFLPLPLEYLPLGLNILLSCLLIFTAGRVLARHCDSILYRSIILCLVVCCTPLVPLSFTGMEHILHSIFCLLWIEHLASVLGNRQKDAGTLFSRQSLSLFILPLLATATRFESMFVAALAALLFLSQRRYLYAMLSAGGCTTSLLLYAWYSLAHGSMWLPNSVMLKASVQDSTLHSVAHAINYGIKQLLEYPEVQLLGIALLACTVWLGILRQQRSYSFYALLTCSWMLLLQVFTAKIGWFFRYEAYLIVTGVVALSIALSEMYSQTSLPRLTLLHYAALSVVVLFCSLPFLHRISKAHRRTPLAVTNIYEQQYQMGRFLQQHYNNASVVLTDIGAPNFLSSIHCTDMLGLGDITVARTRRANAFTQDFAQRYARQRGARIAITFRSWWEGRSDDVVVSPGESNGIPSSWKECGTWRIRNNVICGDDNVQFFALDSTEAQPLQEALKAFAGELPPSVQQSGLYCR